MERAHTVDDDLWGLLTRLRELVEEATGEAQTTGEGGHASGVATAGDDDAAPEAPMTARA